MTEKKTIAAAAKKPQDHLPKAEAKKTLLEANYRGIHIAVAPDVLDDYEAVSLLAKGMPDEMLTILIPDDQDRQTLIESCRNTQTGRIRLSDVVEMTAQIMGALGAGN